MYIDGKEYVPSVTVNIKEKTVEPPPPVPSLYYGDVDMDGKISAYDASLVLAEYTSVSSHGSSSLNADQRTAADVDGDGKIGASDAGAILSFYSYLAANGTEKDIRVWLKKL